MTDRWLCGWRIHSEIPLAELPEWSGDERSPDVTMSLGVVPDCLDNLIASSPTAQMSADRTCRVARAHIAAARIDSAGRVVIIQPDGIAESDLRAFILSTVLAVLCLKRDLLPLHASAVAVDGAAIAFVGRSGVGKSTVAAAFLKRGDTVLTDDVAVIDWMAPGGPRVWPTFPLLKLCPDALKQLDLPARGAASNPLKKEKYFVSTERAFAHESFPLGAIWHLGWAEDGHAEGTVQLRGAAAVRQVVDALYRGRTARTLMGQRELHHAAMRLCSSVAFHAAIRRSRASDVEAFMDGLETLTGPAGPASRSAG